MATTSADKTAALDCNWKLCWQINSVPKIIWALKLHLKCLYVIGYKRSDQVVFLLKKRKLIFQESYKRILNVKRKD